MENVKGEINWTVRSKYMSHNVLTKYLLLGKDENDYVG